MLRFLFLFSCLSLLAGCKPASDPTIRFYYVHDSHDRDHNPDTVECKTPFHHGEGDSLFFKKEIVFNRMRHELRRYSNIHQCGMDGGHVCYELDSLGIIFGSVITWGNTIKQISSSDSLNDIIDFAMIKALEINEIDLSYYHYEKTQRNRPVLDFSKE
jgi:hypothetical protein